MAQRDAGSGEGEAVAYSCAAAKVLQLATLPD
jgi:hypothetical protein